MNCGGKNIVQILLLKGGFWLNYRLSLFVGSGDLIMVGCGWSWVAKMKLWLVAVKLWLVVGLCGELIPGRRWSWVVTGKLWLVVGGRGS